jgi:predicted nucleic acid-binding protein
VSRIFWDTNVFIYLFEGDGQMHSKAVELREAMLRRGDHLATSTLTLGEILVKPMELRNSELTKKYEEAILATAQLIPFDLKAARIFARLRGDRSIRAPDAVQLACAAAAGMDLFITNDERLHAKHVEGIQFIVPLERAPL